MEATCGKVLTLDQLKKRARSLANRCLRNEKFMDNNLLHCVKMRVLWGFLFSSFFGVALLFHSSIRQDLKGWKGSFVDKRMKEVWRAAPLCLF